mgnify:CR=1 FL=1
MLDWLKTILGDVYTEEIDKQVSAEIGKNFVSKADFGAKSETIKDLQGQLQEANDQIQKFQDMDIDGIQKAADDWKEKAEQAERDAAAKIAEMEHDGLLREKLSGMKFTSEYARKGVFDEIKAKGLKVENGQILGFDDAFTAIKEAQPNAFEPDEAPPHFAGRAQGAPPAAGDALRAAMGLPPEKN